MNRRLLTRLARERNLLAAAPSLVYLLHSNLIFGILVRSDHRRAFKQAELESGLQSLRGRPECATKLKKWTLTNLSNERPAGLDLAHKKMDAGRRRCRL